jgi:hypothetical protein
MVFDKRPDTDGSVVAFGFLFSTSRLPSLQPVRRRNPKTVRMKIARFIGLWMAMGLICIGYKGEAVSHVKSRDSA